MFNNNVAFRGSVSGTAEIKNAPIKRLELHSLHTRQPSQTACELVENAKPGEVYREANPKKGIEQSFIVLEKTNIEGEPVLDILSFDHRGNGCGEGSLGKDSKGKYTRLGSLDIII